MTRVLFELNAAPGLADALCARLGSERAELERRRFPDGESYLRYVTPVAGREVVLVCTLAQPDDKIASLLFAAAGGCYSGFDSSGSGADGSASDSQGVSDTSAETEGDDDTNGDTNDDGGPTSELPAPTTRFFRLTHQQWENTVQDLFYLQEPTGLSSYFRSDTASSGYLFANDSKSLSVDGALWSGYQLAAVDTAALVIADPEVMAAILPVDGGDDQARADQFVRDFGLRVFRRPMTEGEVAEYLTLFNNAEGLYALASATLLRGLDPHAVVDELRQRMTEELDYRLEAANQARFVDRYRGHPFIRVPEVVASHSTERMLTTTWASGKRPADRRAASSSHRAVRPSAGSMRPTPRRAYSRASSSDTMPVPPQGPQSMLRTRPRMASGVDRCRA